MADRRVYLSGILGGGLLFVVLAVVVWMNYAPVVAYPYANLEGITIGYFDEKKGTYQEILVEEDGERRRIYDVLKRARLMRVNRGPGDNNGSDGWSIGLRFRDGTEWYGSGVYGVEYGCRKYIRNKRDNSVEGVVIISSEELFDVVEEYLNIGRE